MKKAQIALLSNSKSIIAKTGNQFNGYESNFTHNQKMQVSFLFILKQSYFIFKFEEFSFYFWFKKES